MSTRGLAHMSKPGADIFCLDIIDLGNVQLLLQEQTHQPQGCAMPLERFLAMIATNMVLDVGFNQCFNQAPFGLQILPGLFLVLRLTSGCFLLVLEVANLSLGIEFSPLCFCPFFCDSWTSLACSSCWHLWLATVGSI